MAEPPAMDRLKRQIAEQPEISNLEPPPKIVHKTFARTVQAAMTMGVTLGLVGFLVALGVAMFFSGGSLTLAQGIMRALPWGPVMLVVGALIGAVEFYYLRRGRRS
ncbi:MAG: hypothetical protein AMXMBFR33_46930 [Candidatus Xenobia bacterium]